MHDFKIPCTLVLSVDNAQLRQFHNYLLLKSKFHLKSATNLQKKCPFKFAYWGGKPSSHMHGILCRYLLYSMKNILTMAAPASHGTCVHDTEHLLKETHSPTHTVNFCKYYKGKNLFLTVSRLLANFFKGILDWFAAFGYIFNEEGKYCRLAYFNLCWQQSYFRKLCPKDSLWFFWSKCPFK